MLSVPRVRCFHAIGIALFVLATLAVLATAGTRVATAQSVPLYRLLQERAARGDEWARDYLAQVDAHVAATGKALPPQSVICQVIHPPVCQGIHPPSACGSD